MFVDSRLICGYDCGYELDFEKLIPTLGDTNEPF